MKLFLDCSDPELIAHAFETGLIDGVTTNPSLMLKAGKNPKEVIKEISLITCIGSLPAFNIRLGFVVTPSIKPVSNAEAIGSGSEQSRKSFMTLLCYLKYLE